MANTRDILGDQETLEALISNDPALTEFIEDGIKDAITQYPLSNKDKLVMIDLGEIAKVCGFNNDSKLMHLLLHNTTMVQLISTGSFANTPIKAGYGTIYVPESLLETYRANSAWSTYFFKRLEDYPNYEFGNITDSWETIANNANYATDYAIGDTKTVNFGDYGYMNMELVAFDADDKADGTGKAHMTWIAKDLITKHNYIEETSNWSDSYIRKWLRSDVLCQIPHNILDEIVEVNKTYYDYSSKSTKSETDTIWLPSAKEMSDVSNAENAGVIYTDYFTDNSKRIKKLLGAATVWWLRSNNPTGVGFWAVSYQGVASSGHSSANSYGVAPGFCIGGKSESQYWTDLVAAIREETYTRLYSVGDKLPYTVDGNTYHAVIVGIDADEDALGNKIPFSFITEELWATTYPMNDTATNANGWSASKMRTTTLPAIKAQLPEYVTSNIVKTKKYSYDKTSNKDQVTYDDMWIPNFKELGFTSYQESGGPVYSDVYTDGASRIKKFNGTANYYWTRTAYSTTSTYFRDVSTSGGASSNGASDSLGVAVSFCIGLVTEESLWNELYDTIDDGTYATKYAVGDKLPYTIGDNVYHAVIAGIDVDEDENGNKVPVTFVTEELYAETAAMNDTATNAGGWKESKMRKTTMPVIEALLPEHLRNRINAVKKVSLEYGGTEQVTYDEVWIPSFKELNFDNNFIEQNGIAYALFDSMNSRIKLKIGTSVGAYSSRSSNPGVNSSYMNVISNSGDYAAVNASNASGIALSFSVGHIPEKIQWRMLSDAIEDGTYRDKYHIGDEIPYTTTDGDTYHAVIAAFGGENGDVDADGNAVPVTFVTKELYGTKYRMNATDTNANGWEVTEMRRTTLPSIRAKMPSYVMDGVIPVKKLSYDKTTSANQETVDELWIPSAYELIGSGYEGIGAKYATLFPEQTSRTKQLAGSMMAYWTRTANSSSTNYFRAVGGIGGISDNNTSNAIGLALGFCYGAPASSTTTVAPTATDVSKAYGVEWDYSQSSPQLTRKGLSASFTDPSPATSVSGSGSSPFDSIWPWAGMEVYNITPEGRRIKKGETGFSFTDYDVMVYIPEFWYTAQKDTTNSKWTWAISPTPIAGYEKHPGSGRFVSKYHTSGSASAVASKSGVAPLGNVSQTDFRTYSKNKGDNWYMLDIATWSALQMLYLVEYANFDSQMMLGKGWNTGSVGNVGSNDTAIYHDIKVDGAHNMYRWIEDPFSNAIDWIDGFIGSTSAIYVGTDNSVFDGQVSVLTKAGSLKLPSGGYISGFGYSEESAWAFIPDTASGSDSTYIGDYVNPSSNLYPACVGGNCINITIYGLFYMVFNAATVNFGSRLIYLS